MKNFIDVMQKNEVFRQRFAIDNFGRIHDYLHKGHVYDVCGKEVHPCYVMGHWVWWHERYSECYGLTRYKSYEYAFDFYEHDYAEYHIRIRT